MSSEQSKQSILEFWPLLKDDFEAFSQDPTYWFLDHFEKAAAARDWESIDKLIEIFKIVNGPHEGHHH